MQNNSMAIIAGMLSTLVGGGGVYLQWLDYNKKEEKVIEIQKQSQEPKLQSLSAEEKSLLQPLHPLKAASNSVKSDVQALNEIDINEHSSIKNASLEPVKKLKNSVDDLDLDLPPPSQGFKDFDLDKSGF